MKRILLVTIFCLSVFSVVAKEPSKDVKRKPSSTRDWILNIKRGGMALDFSGEFYEKILKALKILEKEKVAEIHKDDLSIRWSVSNPDHSNYFSITCYETQSACVVEVSI